MLEVAIVGGGLAGLSLARRLLAGTAGLPDRHRGGEHAAAEYPVGRFTGIPQGNTRRARLADTETVRGTKRHELACTASGYREPPHPAPGA